MPKIDHPHDVIFFPTFGRFNESSDSWSVSISGAVVRPGQPNLPKRIMLRLLRRMMCAPAEAFESEIFQQRIQTFAAAALRGKRIEVQLGGRTHLVSRRSQRNGLFSGEIELSREDVLDLQQSGDLTGQWLTYKLVASQGAAVGNAPEAEFVGRAQLVGPTGVSVISDIDDTIKHSSVGDRRELLNNTFLREFQPIFGMSQLYQHWVEQGATMHYVSSSPWQLYHPLSTFCGDELFPSGTFHLRFFRLRDQLTKRIFHARRRGKGKVIHQIVREFPQRRFVLVGDSGEIDPEIYSGVTALYPDRIAAIYIRELPDRPLTFQRLAKMRRRMGDTPLQVFQCSSELPKSLEEAAVLQAVL
ncbi:App1 family protein [Lignipirellula cremea]|nr:phosphatase domain-containing protein [Lignipirellula cremea]